MSKLEIRDLHLEITKDAEGNTTEKPEKWEPVTLDVEVDAGDYRVIRSKVGRKLVYTIKYEMVEDPGFRETPESPAPPAGTIPKRWNKMYRCHFDLNYRKPNPGDENQDTKPISNEEKVTYPELFPEVISKSDPPEGQTWPKDPFYRLYKNYKHVDPTPPETLKECEKKYVGEMHIFIQKLTTLLTKLDIEQKIRPPEEIPPPPPAEGQQESEEEKAKRLKNFIKLNDIKGNLKAEYEILTVKEKTDENTNITTCESAKTEKKKITLRSLKCTEENKDDYEVVDLPIVRF